MGMPARLARFLGLTAWDLLLPALVEGPIKVASNFYQCFFAADAQEQLELLREARPLQPAEVEALVDALAGQWRPFLPGGQLNPAQRAAVRALVAALQAAAQPAVSDPAEVVRKTLNVPAQHLSPSQREICRTVVHSALKGQRGPRPLPTDAPSVPGYALLSVLGDGGFAVVYLARHEASGELSAVKVGKLDDPRRFASEVALLQRLRGEHLVRYHEHGELPGRFWIALEYLGDYTLADLSASRPSAEQALLLAEQVLRGLASLHEAGVIHRDLKPENAVVGAGWRLKLIDFGIAKDQTGPGKTTTLGSTAGTALYMSPEQIRGKAVSASDVWAFGCVVMELFTGRPLFAAENIMAVAIEIDRREIKTDAAEIPPEVRDFLGRCLQRDPAQRFANAGEALKAFVPVAEAARRRLRYERTWKSWGEILDKRLLERFVESGGDTVAGFVALARQEGIADVDEVRLREILPPILAAGQQVRDAEQAIVAAKQRLTQESSRLVGDELVRRAEQIRELEKVPGQRRQQVRQVIESLLIEERRGWDAHVKAEAQKRQDAEAAAQRQREAQRRMLRRVALGVGIVAVLALFVGGVIWAGQAVVRWANTPKQRPPLVPGPNPIASDQAPAPGWHAETMTLVAPFTPDDIKAARAAWVTKGYPERKTLTYKGVAFEFVLIPPGTFQMGSPSSEKDRGDNEMQHPVDLTEPFYLLATEVTQEMYATLAPNPSFFKGDKLPVGSVRWTAAEEFCRKLRVALEVKIRLPSEAQWEYACRAGTTTVYPFGDNQHQLGEFAWYLQNSDGQPHEAGTRPTNAFGLHDMLGNLSEWCADAYQADYQNLPRRDPLAGGQSDSMRVVRGGSYIEDHYSCRSWFRHNGGPNDHSTYQGFRLLLVP